MPRSQSYGSKSGAGWAEFSAPTLAMNIADLSRKGVCESEIREDYPALSNLDLAFASTQARSSPPPGWPRKPLELGREKAHESSVRFLLDEHLSQTLVSRMASLGCYGVAVPHVGLGGASDPTVWRYAYENDLTVITTNARDFLALLDVEVHPGLIVLREGGLSRREQWDRIEPVLRYLLERNDPNKVIEIKAPDRFSTREVPPSVPT